MSSAPRDLKLAALLGEAAAAGIIKERSLACLEAEDGARFFADTIRSTILPRRLEFSCDGVVRLTAIAKGGTLLSLGEAGEETLRPVGTSDLSLIALQLKNTFPAGRLSVRTSSVAVPPDTARAGIHGDSLLQSFSPLPALSAPCEYPSILFEAARDVAIAVFRSDGTERILDSGSPNLPEAREWAQSLFAKLPVEAAHLDEEHLVVFRASAFPHLAACLHVTPDKSMVLLIHRDASEDVAAFWASLQMSGSL